MVKAKVIKRKLMYKGKLYYFGDVIKLSDKELEEYKDLVEVIKNDESKGSKRH